MTTPTSLDRISGSLLGGAVGDALGAGIEFLSLSEIRKRFGPAGVIDYVPAYGRRGAITDDTQMTLFTADGLIRAWVRGQLRGMCSIPDVIHHAYLRWLLTQGERPRSPDVEIGTDGQLFGIVALHDRRAPGNTCLSALRVAEGFGSPLPARNDSKGCGAVMRAAPVGLFCPPADDAEMVFRIASDAGALTHGHPSGHLSAGYLAATITELRHGAPLESAMRKADDILHRQDNHEEVAGAILAARRLAAAGRPSPEQIEALGGGWVGEEALAIALCCALVAEDFADGVLLAINHSGDSDSTGAVAGNLLGAQLGVAAIPSAWLDELELREEIERIAADLDAVGTGRLSADDAWEAYPGW